VLDSADWKFCTERLVKVSRTFSIPIGMLRERLQIAVTCGYLLCRIVDTVEDDDTLAPRDQDALYDLFLAALEGYGTPEEFAERFKALTGFAADSDEYILASQTPRVFAVLATLPDTYPSLVTRWVAEMTYGMAIYSHRPVGGDGLHALLDPRDLERYCYFVAGTVGHMLTDLFIEDLAIEAPERIAALRAEAEEFGLGLQLVNILKDITDDRERGWSFVPRSQFESQGLSLEEALLPENRERAWRAVTPVFDRATKALEGAFRYALALPPNATDVRLFCLLPLWMAVRTLAVARGNDGVFVPGEAVKISRDEVGAILAAAGRVCGDDDALRKSFERLWREPADLAFSV